MRVPRYGHDAQQPPRQAAEFRFLVADTSLQSPFSIYPRALPDRFGFPCAPNTVRTHISGRKPLRFAATPQCPGVRGLLPRIEIADDAVTFDAHEAWGGSSA